VIKAGLPTGDALKKRHHGLASRPEVALGETHSFGAAGPQAAPVRARSGRQDRQQMR